MLFNTPNWEVQKYDLAWNTVAETFSRAEAERHFEIQNGNVRIISLWDYQVVKVKYEDLNLGV